MLVLTQARIDTVCRLLAGLAAAYALLTLASWTELVPDITTLGGGSGRAAFASGIALLIASAVVFILSTVSEAKRRVGAALVCTAVIMAIALYTIAGYALRLEGAGYLLGPNLGRVSPASSICLLLLGGAFISICRGGYWPAALLCVIGFILCETAVVGYMFDVYALSSVFVFSAMTLPTALSLGLLFVATLMIEPNHSWARRFSGGGQTGLAFWLLMPVSVVGPVALTSIVLRTVESGAIDAAFGLAVLAVSLSVLLGTIVVMTCFRLDRSERNSARLVAIVESSDDAIMSNALDGTFTSWNAGAERMFGYGRGEALGRHMNLIIPPHRAEDARAQFELLMSGQSVAPFEAVSLRKDGSELDVSVTLSPLKLASGTVIGASAIMRDITDMRRRDNELRRSNAELEQFAYIASHDLQEPLRMVANYVELLARRYEGQLDEKADKYIHYASDGARRMQQLVTDLLAYSRVGSQGKPLERVDTNAIVERAMRSLSTAIDASKAKVEVDILPPVLGDEVQLGQLFQNLIGNAIKFRAEAPPHIHISAGRDKRLWRFSVRDNGIGMDMRHADRIFQMFQRMHQRDKYEGSGIGLAIAKRIVERHGGEIWLESEPGAGTTFFFTLRATVGMRAA